MAAVSTAIFLTGYHAVRLFISEADSAAFGEEYLKTIAFSIRLSGLTLC